MPEFDLVAPLYDETRRPPSENELGTVAEALGSTTEILEGGVGTARYALPLEARGFHLTGVDISIPMMRRAREKGFARLVQADIHHLPFRDRAFDGSLVVHVLQLVPDPFPFLSELARVSRDRVVAFLPEHYGLGIAPAIRGQLRQRYAEIAKEMGVTVELKPRYWQNAQRILQQVPPEQVWELREEYSPSPDAIKRWQDLRSFGGLVTVPPEVHAKIVERLRQEMGGEFPTAQPRVRTARIGAWNPEKLREEIARLAA